MNKPEGYQNVMPYLILKDAEKFMAFAKEVFGATEKMKVMREDGSTIMHGELQLGDSVVMLAEATEKYPPVTSAMMIYINDTDKSYQKALHQGCQSLLAPHDADYGRSAGVLDTWGNTWWITSL